MRNPLRGRGWLARLVLQGGVVVALLVAFQAWQRRGLLEDGGMIAAPAFALRDLEGRDVTLSGLRGKTLVLQFWATWCGVCRREVSTLNAVNEGLGPNEALYAIALDDDPAVVRRFVAEQGVGYPVLLGTSAVGSDYRVAQLPTTYVIGPDGRIRDSDTGWISRWGLEWRLSRGR